MSDEDKKDLPPEYQSTPTAEQPAQAQPGDRAPHPQAAPPQAAPPQAAYPPAGPEPYGAAGYPDAPAAPRFRDRVLGMRAVIAVAVASVILGGVRGRGPRRGERRR